MDKKRPDLTLSGLVKWSGRGSFPDFRTTATGVLQANNVRNARLTTIGSSLALQGIQPAAVLRILKNLPGVEWLALGKSTEPDTRSVNRTLASIAKNYLTKGSTFRVVAEVPGDKSKESDLAGAAASLLLDEFRGVRIDEKHPKTTFRVVVDSSMAVAGVEVQRGVGGAPTSQLRRAHCLVSGGMHSSVVAWMAARSGHSVSLLHVFESDESIRETAKIYAELSQRMDPRALKLQVLFPEESSSVGRVLLAWLRSGRSRTTFSGAHSECGNASFLAPTSVARPLFLLSEEDFEEIQRSLGLRGYSRTLGALQSRNGSDKHFTERSFGGIRADVHLVLDTLLS